MTRAFCLAALLFGCSQESSIVIATCEVSTDCRGGEICRGGQCREACSDSDPCTLEGSFCSVELGYCVRACESNSDCRGGELCIERQCDAVEESDAGTSTPDAGTDAGASELDASADAVSCGCEPGATSFTADGCPAGQSRQLRCTQECVFEDDGPCVGDVECVPACDSAETCQPDGSCRCGSNPACTGGRVCFDNECVPPSCANPAACVPGSRNTESCGRCGSKVDECQPDCTWDVGVCSGEGECDPSTTMSTPDGCPAGQWRVLECSASCAFEETQACSVPSPVTFEFPTGDESTSSLGAWHASAIEATVPTSLYVAREMEMTLTPSNTVLASGCSLSAQVLINGVQVGTFHVPWESMDTINRTFMFAPITGPDYTIRYQTMEGRTGCGAVIFDPGPIPHTVTLRP